MRTFPKDKINIPKGRFHRFCYRRFRADCSFISKDRGLIRTPLFGPTNQWAARLVGTMLLIIWTLLGCSEFRSSAAELWAETNKLYQISRLGEWNEESIPKASLEYAGEVGLEFRTTIELVFNKEAPGIGQIGWMEITPDSSLLLADRISREAHEFSLRDGRYIRSFGRRGKGPGEYGNAQKMAMDSKGRIYIHDNTHAQLLRYDRHGRYSENKMDWIGGVDFLFNREDALFVMEKRFGRFIQIRRITCINGDTEYILPLFDKKEQLITCRSGNPALLHYNQKLNHLYYLETNDYMVKEINAKTGEILRQFGDFVPRYDFDLKLRSPNFKFLPNKYHGIDCGSIDIFTEAADEIHRVTSMVLLKNRFLLISHTDAGLGSPNEWTLYDVEPYEKSKWVKSYSLNRNAYEFLNGIGENAYGLIQQRIDGRITSWQDQVYVYKPPTVENAEISNGHIEVYGLAFPE